MASTEHIAFIGAGNMATALMEGLLQSGTAPTSLVACDINAATLAALGARLNIPTTTETATALKDANVVMLCVKPQTLPELLPTLAPQLRPDALVISVAAGVTTAALEAPLATGMRVIRAMPNTPALVKAGATGIAPGQHATSTDMEQAAALFRCVGEVVSVTEPQLDAVTGVSGSGPAYVFRFAEALRSAALAVGLDDASAKLLASQTLFGAATLLRQSGEDPGVLRTRVTSKGGTTAAGLAVLEETGFQDAIHACVRAATLRSKQLGQEATRSVAPPAPASDTSDDT